MNIVTDTHPWIWFLTANPRLSPKAKAALSDPTNLIIIPSIVTLEIKYLYERKRIPLSFEDILLQIETGENIILHPLDISVAIFAPTRLDIHDAIIVGTALCLSNELGQSVSLVTVDSTISNSGFVKVIW